MKGFFLINISAAAALILAACSSSDEPSVTTERSYCDIYCENFGDLAANITAEVYECDSLVVHGPINANDLHELSELGIWGNVEVLDLRYAQIENRCIPDKGLSVSGSYMMESKIRRYILPGDLVEIGDEGFGYTQVESINLPSGLRSIGEKCFYKCHRLRSITIPSGVEEIPESCFFQCLDLEKVGLPDGVRSIGAEAFAECRMLEDLNIPSALEAIGDNAFAHTALRNATLPSGCVRIGNRVFSGCYYIDKLVIPEGVAEISAYFINDNIRLRRVEIPVSAKKIGKSAFADCLALAEVVFRDGLEEIADMAFANSPLAEIVLPSTLKAVGKQSFTVSSATAGVMCMATTPPVCAADAFIFGEESLKSSVPLYVPSGSESLYMLAAGWSDFKDIRAI